MTDISAKFGLGGGSGAFLDKPYKLLVGSYVATGLNNYSDVAAASSAAAGFWTRMAQIGYAIDTNFTADTYKDIVDVTSGNGGIVANLIGPTAGGAETTTFRITLPSGTYEFPVLLASGDRAFMGVYNRATPYDGGNALYGYDDLNAAKTIYTPGTPTYFCSVTKSIQLGKAGSLMGFDSTCKLEAKHSANVTGTGASERKCGAIIQLSI